MSRPNVCRPAKITQAAPSRSTCPSPRVHDRGHAALLDLERDAPQGIHVGVALAVALDQIAGRDYGSVCAGTGGAPASTYCSRTDIGIGAPFGWHVEVRQLARGARR